MEEFKVEQAEGVASQTANAERTHGEEQASVSYGKFKDATALLKAYESLEAEFTKRCQRIKELEKVSSVDKSESEKSLPTDNAQTDFSGITEENKKTILEGYLKEVLGAKTNAVVLDRAGTGVRTPTSRPTTVQDAGRLAKELFGG